MSVTRGAVFFATGTLATALIWAVSSSIGFAAVCLPFSAAIALSISRTVKPQELPPILLPVLPVGPSAILLIIGLIALLAISVIAVLVGGATNHNRADQLVLLGTAALATVGWTAGTFTAIRNQRKQHTMNILLQMRDSELLAFHKENIVSRFPPDTDFTDKDYEELREQHRNWRVEAKIDGRSSPPILESVYYILNYYEFICAGIQTHDIDRRLIKRTIGGMMFRMVEKCAPVFTDERKPRPDGSPSTVYAEIARTLFEFGYDIAPACLPEKVAKNQKTKK